MPVSASASCYGAAESVAQSHGLLTDVDAAMNDPLSRYQMAVEIRNLLLARGCAFSENAAQESAASIDSQPGTVSDDTQAFREEVLRLVNEARAEEGLKALTLSDKLTQAAQIRAEELPDNFSHIRPDGSSCFTVLSEVGVRYMATGENIAAGQRTSADVMDSWMNSTGHRANILSKNYGELGLGVCKAPGAYGVYWVQLFAD